MASLFRIIDELQEHSRLRACCPHCGGEFSLRRATLFPISGPIPLKAEEIVRAWKREVAEGWEDLRLQVRRAREAPGRGRVSASVGQVMEALVPMLDGASDHRDWRRLSDPVDYLVFDGLARHGAIEAVTFVEVKTGVASLNAHQKMVKEAVESGRVSWQLGKLRGGWG